jgi:FtsP/CotA-like multicopper oxidase with cupredoxin domain
MKLITLAAAVAGALAVVHSGGDGAPIPASPTPPAVVPNDNRAPAGRWRGDTLVLELDVGMAAWTPEAESDPAIEVAAFSEAGESPRIPGPLIRVPAGATIRATVRNRLPDSTITVRGLVSHPAISDDSLVLRPEESRQVTFAAGSPGTYFYLAVLGHHDLDKDDEREQLSGAFIVDPPGGSPPDRVFVMNIWGRTIDSATYSNALAINGRSWPHTERIVATVGDTLRWRLINATARNHPMHLHGFYYRVDSRGNGLADTLYPAQARRLVVTEGMQPFTTMAMTWGPDRPGNWLFHCHIGFHVLPDARLDPAPAHSPDRMAHDPGVHMAGLILGIVVRPREGAVEAPRGRSRHLRLFIQEGPKRGRSPRAMGFVLARGTAAPAPDSIEIPGSTLLLTRDEPTDIVVINRLHEPAAVHWHGIELESYSDGVTGWSGEGERLAPSIMPGDSFTARLTLPRSGTFIYHTHLNDIEQLTAGLYGGIVVLEPGRRFDPAHDHLFVAGWDGDGEPPRVLVNGDSMPPPLELAAGRMHRFRFVNIGPALRFAFSIYRDTALVGWRRKAKDGADLPLHQAVTVPAREVLDVGETFDAELRLERGEYRLLAARDPARPYYVRRLIVR